MKVLDRLRRPEQPDGPDAAAEAPGEPVADAGLDAGHPPAGPRAARGAVPPGLVRAVVWLTIAAGLGAVLSPYWMRLVMQAYVTVIAMLGLYVLTGLTGQISLAQAAFMGIGAYATTVLVTVHGVPYPVALPLAVACTVPLALLLALPALRVGGILLAIVTLGFSYAADYSLFVTSWLTGFPNGRPIERPAILQSDAAFYYVALGSCVIVVLLVMRLAGSRLGRAFQAVRDGEHAASASGVSVVGVKLASFTIAGLLGGIAGALYAPMVGYTNGGVAFTSGTSLALMILGVLAGLGSVRGAVVAGVTYAIAPALSPLIFRNSLATFQYQQIVFAALLIVALIRNPDGLVAHASHRREEKARRKQEASDAAA